MTKNPEKKNRIIALALAKEELKQVGGGGGFELIGTCSVGPDED